MPHVYGLIMTNRVGFRRCGSL